METNANFIRNGEIDEIFLVNGVHAIIAEEIEVETSSPEEIEGIPVTYEKPTTSSASQSGHNQQSVSSEVVNNVDCENLAMDNTTAAASVIVSSAVIPNAATATRKNCRQFSETRTNHLSQYSLTQSYQSQTSQPATQFEPRPGTSAAVLSSPTVPQQLQNQWWSNHSLGSISGAILGLTCTTSNIAANHPLLVSTLQNGLYNTPTQPVPTCCHPYCIFFRDLITCLSNWITQQQFMEYMTARFGTAHPAPLAPPPALLPAFEIQDPPESEWVTAPVYAMNPDDGIVRYKCRKCDGEIKRQSTKQRDILNRDRLKYSCAKCDKKYLTYQQLKTHLLRHREKRYACFYCDKPFLTIREVRNHLNTHTQEKPFSCPLCRKKFAHSSMYYLHIRTFHTRYECKDCFSKSCSSRKEVKHDST